MGTSYFKFFILLSFSQVFFLGLLRQFLFSAVTVGRSQSDADSSFIDIKPRLSAS